MLLAFAQQRVGRSPAQMSVSDLDAALVGDFLEHLQSVRGNATATRNARLAAIHSFFRHAALHAPEHAAVIQRVLAIPSKRVDREIVDFLTHEEVDAILLAPDLATWIGRRDHVLLLVAAQSGFRVSELTVLTLQYVQLGDGPHLRHLRQARQARSPPLTHLALMALTPWLAGSGGPYGALAKRTRRVDSSQSSGSGRGNIGDAHFNRPVWINLYL